MVRYRDAIMLMLSLAIFLVTFQRFEPLYGTGLDPSYIWAFNFLVRHDYSLLTGLTYPIGPIGFLKYIAAWQDNLMYGLIFYSLVKLSFVFLLLQLNVRTSGRITVFSFLVALTVSAYAGVDFSIIGSTVILLILQFLKQKGITYFVLANVFALTGLFIKSSIGISAFSSILGFFLLTFSYPRFSLKKSSLLMAISLIMYLGAGLLVFRSIGSFYDYLTGFLHLAEGYADGLALFPDNNWWLLGGFLFTFLVAPMLFRSEHFRVGYFLLLLPLFAMWKHAMGREDFSHAGMLFAFLFTYWGILILLIQHRRIILIALAAASILMYLKNLERLPDSQPYNPQLRGLTNFQSAVLDYKAFNAAYQSLSEQNIRVNAMDDSVKSLIGPASVEAYPWDLSYIPANGFRWKPRPTLELGASTSSWLSRLAASGFRGPAAPEYVIFHLENDRWGGRFGSLDGRYILNDEPLVMEQMLANYNLIGKNLKYLLLKKENSDPIRKVTARREWLKWDSWIEVPESGNRILRLVFVSNKTLMGHLKSFFYKGEAYYMDYKFSDGKVLTYRFLASNAEDGLWINPFILRPDKDYMENEVVAVRFRCSNYLMVRSKIEVSWQLLGFDDGRQALSWFGKRTNRSPGVLYSKEFQSGLRADTAGGSADYFTDGHPGVVGSGQFGPGVTISLDTIWQYGQRNLEVSLEVYYAFPEEYDGKAMLVLSLEESRENVWLSFPFTAVNDNDTWHYAYLGRNLSPALHSKGMIKAYVWNNGKSEIVVDDLKIWFDK